MQRKSTRTFPYEDLLVGCLALTLAVACALALFDLPAGAATRGVSYTEFVRTPAVEQPAPTPTPPQRPRVANLPVAAGAAEISLSCSPGTQAELRRLLALCQG